MTVFNKSKVVMESDVSDSSSEEEQEVTIRNTMTNITKKGKIGGNEGDDEESREEDDVDCEEQDEQSEELEDEDEVDEEQVEEEEDVDDPQEDDVQTVKTDNTDDSSDDDDEEKNDEDLENQNIAWADSIANILKTNKPKTKKTLVLSKAKKLTDARQEKPKPAGFEVEKVDGEIKEEQIEPEVKEESGPPRKKKKEIASIRRKPNILEKDREKSLMKIATKGVVQLFNAVKNQQKEIDTKLKEAGPLDVKKEKVLKKINKQAFLDTLQNQKSQVLDNKDLIRKEVEDGSKTTWSVLRDDFMMGGKMKNWDKEQEDDKEDELEIDNEMEFN